jgi:uncharacterized UPF0160 family protein
MSNTIKKLITHDGSFHADDIFATATLSILLEKKGEVFEVVRTRDDAVIKSGDYVFDVGGIYDEDTNRFDHHQPGGAGKRENSIEYSSVGLVWKKFGLELCGSKKVADLIDKKLISPIDAGDNGIDLFDTKGEITPYLLQNVFFSMHPTWKEDENIKNEMFFKCVEMAKLILSREIVQARDMVFAEEALINIYNNTEDKRIIVLDENYPFEFVLHDFPEPVFVVYPRKTDKSWGVKVVKSDPKTFSSRKDLPSAWGGLQNEELVKVTGVPDALFCHRALFLCAARSKEGAIKLAQIALQSSI